MKRLLCPSLGELEETRRKLREARERIKLQSRQVKETRRELREARGQIKLQSRQLKTLKPELARQRSEVKHLKALDDFYTFALKYHKVGNTGGTWKDTYWLGARALKLPLDLWVYQEILYETRPDLIIETGTAFGGSALYLASVCDLLGTGRILSIDISETGHIEYVSSAVERPRHPRIRYLHGSSTNPTIVDEVKREAKNAQRTMVVLDSDHSEEHVYAELKAYAPLLSIGGYLVVEDTHFGGDGDWSKPHEPHGPGKAVQTFLEEDSRFEVDPAREKFLITFNHNGYLKRVR